MTDSQYFLAVKASVLAGQAIMEIYNRDFEVEFKPDDSPLTIADKKAHQIIVEQLAPLNLPVLSEEGSAIDYSLRKNWIRYWLVDPLDGTKEFVKRNGDFTVNIALIDGEKPLAGIIYVPVHKMLYYAFPGVGCYRYELDFNTWRQFDDLSALMAKSVRLPLLQHRDNFVVVSSKSHRNQETEALIVQLQSEIPAIEFLEVGSSLKFCRLAEGSADLYPRAGPTMEWDTAAGHAIAEIAGCKVRQLDTDQPLLYNKMELLNPFFLVERNVKLK